LIEHAIDALRPVVDEVVLSGRSYGGLVSVADRPASGMGPLGGLNAVLHHAARHGFDAVLTVGCDTPSLPVALLDRLRETGGPAYVSDLPVIGIWPASLAARLDGFLGEDRKHAIRAWADVVSAEAINWPALANVNEPADIEALRGERG
jgi:molybdopterin-guanine dinucleotide biosynthesis protein A